MSELLIRAGGRALARFRLTKPQINIGSSDENDLILIARGVSRGHCRIHKTERGYAIVDLGSRTGVRLNNKPVITELIRTGDRITLGPFELECRLQLLESMLDHLADHIGSEPGPEPGINAPEEDARPAGSEEYEVGTLPRGRLRVRSTLPDRKAAARKDSLRRLLFPQGIAVIIALILAVILFLFLR